MNLGSEESIDTVAYWLALLTIVMVPPFMFVWYLVHPFAGFWRRLGPIRTYTSLILLMLPTMGLIYNLREPLLRIHYGVNWLLVILAVQFFVISVLIGIIRMRHLKPSIMIGLPEISGGGDPGKLLTEGIYAKVRHPRYVEVWLGLLALALFTNYLVLYILVFLFVPLTYGVVLMEEKELRERFGEEYEKYCRDVPRFLPKSLRLPRGGC
jgi:protein-S-isoprenylcysteine O-methyltransferase Ste14